MIEANRSFSLHLADKVWLLEKGSLNVFATSPSGARVRLMTLQGPSVLFSWENEANPLEIIAISEEASTLSEQVLSEFDPLPYLNQWIYSFGECEKKESFEPISLQLPEKGEVSIPKGTLFEGKRAALPVEKEKIYWLRLIEGKLSLYNYNDPAWLEAGQIIPITHSNWMQAKLDSKVEIFSTEEAVQRGIWREGLKQFHRLLALHLQYTKKQQEKEELARIKQKKEREKDNLSSTFSAMAELLNPMESAQLISTDPLLKACQILGNSLDISFLAPDDSSQTRDSFLSALCRASNVRYRKIDLTGPWWQEDSTHLLGFLGKEEKPVVLLNSSSCGYEMLDPQKGERQKITAALAADLSNLAYMFYRPFPDDLTTGKQLIQWYWKRHYHDFIPLVIYGAVAAIISLFPPFAAAILFNIVIPNIAVSLLFQIAIGLFTAALASSLFFFFRSLILVRIQGLAGHEILTAFWDRLLKLPSAFFHRFSSGNLFFRVHSIEEIRTQLSANGARAILSGIFSFFYFFMMALYSPTLTLVPLFLVICSGLVTWFASTRKVRIQKESLELRGQINGSLIQIVGGIPKLRVAGAESGAFAYWAKIFTKNKKLEMEAQFVQSGVIVINSMLLFLGPLLLFALAISLQKQTGAPTWVFLAFNAAFLPFTASLFDLTNTLIDMVSSIPLWKRAKAILEEPLEITHKQEKPGKLKGEISIDRVSFRYDDSSPLVLNDISIAIHPGEFVAIVGPSGSGKSTLLRLLLGFEQPVSGAILFDGKELNDLIPQEVRKQLGVVLQDSGLITGTIFENITCGGVYSKEEIEQALHLSGFEEELENFPMGLNTIITTGGATFSGGQKQRLLITRALVSKPKVLIFDEATSFLDNRTQDQVSRNIEQLEISRIVVAHRLSTIRGADRIYVLDQGKIAQWGSYEALSNEKGLFQDMLLRQKI